MKTILSIPLYRMQHGEHYHFSDNLMPLFTDELVARHNLSEVISPMNSAYEKFTQIYVTSRKSMITPEIKAKSKERDDAFIGFKQRITPMLRIGTPEEKAAAKTLGFLVDMYGAANREDYTTNTSLLNGFIRDARGDKFVNQIATLGLTNIVDRIETLNNEFNELYNSRSIENFSTEQAGKLAKIRRAFDLSYYNLRGATNALFLVANLQKNTSSIKELSTLIDQINALVRSLQDVMSRRGVNINKNSGNIGESDSGSEDNEDNSSEGISL